MSAHTANARDFKCCSCRQNSLYRIAFLLVVIVQSSSIDLSVTSLLFVSSSPYIIVRKAARLGTKKNVRSFTELTVLSRLRAKVCDNCCINRTVT